jgi:hypothetical protein
MLPRLHDFAKLARVLRPASSVLAVAPGAVAVLLATGFLVVHLAFLPRTPTGVDAVNFVLGVRDFNVADHRPHPPGYPVFMALGKASRAILERFPLAPDADLRQLETVALAMWSAVFGAMAVFSLRQFFRTIDPDDRRAVAAAALTVTCPLFWFNAIRPMSDISGLAAALAAQALILSGFRRSREARAGARALLISGALVAGIAIGVRSQASWLTLPLLSFVTIDRVRRARDRTLLYGAAALTTGALLWGVPLVLASGGPGVYVAALAAQAGEDVSSGTMLAIAPDVSTAVDALIRMIAYPWANKYLAVLIVGLAMVGGISMVVRAPRAGALLALSFGPYAMYHLLFQDTTFGRYVLPVVPPLAYFAVRGLDTLARPMMAWLAAALAVGCLVVAMPSVVSYARTGSPSLRALDSIRDRLSRTEQRPVLAMHHAISRVLRLEGVPAPTLSSPPKHEWLELARYWNNSGDAPIWFLAEPERTDLALIDPNGRHLVDSFRLPVDRRFFMSGLRPSGVDWYQIDVPSWFAGEGWALTPETAGVASADGKGPGRAPITAYVRRRVEAAVVMIGGRYLDPGEKVARFDLSIDGRPIDSWVVDPNPGFFLRMLQVPAGSLQAAFGPNPVATHAATGSLARDPDRTTGGRYSRLQIRSVAADGSRAPVKTSVEQFDVQSVDHLVFGFGEGWFEQEYDPAALRLWRWTAPTAALRIHHGGCDLTLRVTGHAPVNLLGSAAKVAIRAGDSVLGRVTVSRDFELRARVPADALDRSGGLLTIESDRSFVPEAALGNGDRRRLALRVFDLGIERECDRHVSPPDD